MIVWKKSKIDTVYGTTLHKPTSYGKLVDYTKKEVVMIPIVPLYIKIFGLRFVRG